MPVKSWPVASGATHGSAASASPSAEPVKSWPDAPGAKAGPAPATTYKLNAVTPANGQPPKLRTAKRVALPGRSIMAVPVELVGHRTKDSIQLSAPEQRFGECLVIPEGLYVHWPGSANVF